MNESKILTADSIIGEKVKNTEGESLGEIKELLIDPETGKIEYGVVGYGGHLLGIGQKLIAVPYEALTLQKEEDYFILNVDRETLETAQSEINYQGKSYFIY